jgi:Membrane-associated lipoprotein involved in thiamine biosynthesis
MISRLLLSIILCTFFLSSCSNEGEYYEERGTVFHTYYKITYQSPKPLSEKIDEEFVKFNLSLNPFNPNSIISKVNRNEPTELDEWFTEVFNKAQEVSERTEGAFDITCAPMINIWGFGFQHTDNVNQQMIDSIKTFVGYNKIRIEDGRIVKDDQRVMLNCSAIAKGYACDVIARLLEREGVTNYMIDIGGETIVNGVNHNGIGWRIGINEPEDEDNSTGIIINVHEIIQLNRKGGIATSGNYRNFYIKDGKKYAHTIDPRTGYPSEQSILSATVVADDCMTADAYATAFMVMGIDKVDFIRNAVPEIEYYLIYSDEKGNTRSTYSEGMLKYFLPERQKLAILENS